ncbi:DUF1439 domain-containing protein [Trinickia sp. LjRoot230]|uniref:DUF1439 domain-containing protein n=1 Tax=Trinickia sp. LjRoot230 TaxID=3342288 RepID=UPI003ECE04B7
MTHAARASRRRFLTTILTLSAAASFAVPIAACATRTFPFIPDHYTFSQRQVQQAVARKFPYRRTVSQFFDVALTDPAVGFAPDANRVTVKLDAHVSSPFLQQPVDGVFTLSSRLEYDGAQRAIVLRSPNVESVDVQGEVRAYQQQIEAAGALAAAQWLDGYPIYTFKPEELQFAGATFEPGTITILTNGIRVQIVEK